MGPAGKNAADAARGDLDLYTLPLPRRLDGRTLAESGIGAKTGLSVLAVRHDGAVVTNPPAATVLEVGSELVCLGDPAQRAAFVSALG